MWRGGGCYASGGVGWMGGSEQEEGHSAYTYWPPDDTEGALGYLDKSKPFYVFFLLQHFSHVEVEKRVA